MTIQNAFPAIKPSLNLDFANTKQLDPRITFTRSTTATFTGSNGQLQTAAINAPRFGYDPVTLAPLGLLIEEQRTNMLTFSEQFDNAAWNKSSITVTSNNAVAPDGSNTAETLTDSLDASLTVHAMLQTNGTFVSGTSYTASFYAKQGTLVGCLILFPSTAFTSNITARFRLDTGTVAFTDAGVTAVITPVGNGWYRCSATATATSSATAPLQFRTATSAESFYQGAGNGTIQAWGAQLEAGAFPTSYIPTVASQVTRAADVAVMTGTNFSSWYNAAEGTLFGQFLLGSNANRVIMQFTDGTNNNTINMRYASNTQPQLQVSSGGVIQAELFGANASTNIVYNRAASVGANDFREYVNGAVSGTPDTSGVMPVLTQMNIGATRDGFNFLCGHIRRVAYYPRRLSNAELQSLTT